MSDRLENYRFEELPYYHPHADRHTAESILLLNGKSGTYLMRPGSKANEVVISVKAQDSVKHWRVVVNKGVCEFGAEKFTTRQKFLDHIENHPVLSNKSGDTVVLLSPYPNDIQEYSEYETAIVHGEAGKTSLSVADFTASLAVNSKSGYLTKRGYIVKSWKRRWFVLDHNLLKYFRDRNDCSQALRTLDLNDCEECDYETGVDKEYCFRLRFPWRIFYFHSQSKTEADEWVKLIQWKLANIRPM